MNKYLFTCIFIFLCLILITGCGKKRWPTADVSEEQFYWENVNSTRQGKCLQITASINGNIRNLNKIILLLEESGTMCPDCPFRATEVVPVYTAFEKDNSKSRFEFEYCELKKGKSYRFRLKGINAIDNIKATKTKVY